MFLLLPSGMAKFWNYCMMRGVKAKELIISRLPDVVISILDFRHLFVSEIVLPSRLNILGRPSANQ